MVFAAIGLNHKTAPLSIREIVSATHAMHDARLSELVALPEIHEAALLSTCNRTEIYCDTEEPARLSAQFAKIHQLRPESITPHLYLHAGEDGIRHTLRVASGLDSMMLGEPQILGQMKQAYHQGCQLGTIKHTLQPMFQYVFSATKRIRHQSGINHNPISIAFAAVQLIGQIFQNFHELKVFIIGSGETATLVAKYLAKEGVHQFMIASRTHDNAQLLAENLSARTLEISDIPEGIRASDVVISATSCPLPFITKSMVQQALSRREMAQLFFLDLAVPRDVEPSVATLKEVHLYNIDSLQKITAEGLDKRQHAAIHAEQLIEVELNKYIQWHRSLKARQVITNYRAQMKALAKLEVERAMQKLTTGQCHAQVLEELSTRLVNKLIHIPTLGLKQAARHHRDELLNFALFLLDHPAHEKIT